MEEGETECGKATEEVLGDNLVSVIGQRESKGREGRE